MSIIIIKVPLFVLFVSSKAIMNSNNSTQTGNVLLLHHEQEVNSAKLGKAPVEDYAFSEYGDGKYVKLPTTPFWRNVRLYKENRPFFESTGQDISVNELEKIKPRNEKHDLIGRSFLPARSNEYVDAGYYYMTENGDFALYNGPRDNIKAFKEGWTLDKGAFHQYRGKGDYYLSPSGVMFKISGKKKRSGPYTNPASGDTYLFNEELWVYYPESSKPDVRIKRPMGNNIGRKLPWMRNRL